jgi:hypothetical protein
VRKTSKKREPIPVPVGAEPNFDIEIIEEEDLNISE